MRPRSAAAIPMPTEERLLGGDEPSPVLELGRQRRSNFVIVVDHASQRIPQRLHDLGLPARELRRHIGWDIGALDVARRLAEELDAVLVAQNYSRLVIDCNRDPSVESSIPTVSEYTVIPGNIDLTAEQIGARRREIFEPYHAHLRALLDERQAVGRRTLLIAQHSMTDVYKGAHRAMHAAVLYNRDRRLAELLLQQLRRDPLVEIADNEPYSISDATDYTIPRHGEARGLPHVEIEIRQDLLLSDAGQIEWALRLAASLRAAERALLGAQ
jgi:predicted N-formylglutamate amidohydrolase